MIKKILMFLWLFPMNIIGLLNSKRYIADFKDVKVYRWRFWIKGFSTAWGDRILFFHKHEQKYFDNPDKMIYLLRHEYEHIKQQRKYGAVLFLVLYLLDFIKNFLFVKKSRFNWYNAYYNISFEKQAREAEKR